MKLRDMEVFRAVMLAGTIKGAAEMLHISQPAASKLLALAESRSGIRLFDRVKGRLVATPEAHRLYPEIENAWRTLDRVRDVSRELAQPRAGSLRLAASSRFCTFLVPSAVTALMEAFPDMGVRVEMIMPHLLSDALESAVADIGIVMQTPEPPGLATLRRYTCGLVCVLPEKHPLTAKSVITPADLVGQQLIAFSREPPFGYVLEQVYGGLLDDLHIHLEVSSGPTACWFVRAGAGIAVLDAPAIAGDPFPGLVTRPFHPNREIEVRILYKAHRRVPETVRVFCDTFDVLWRDYVDGKSYVDEAEQGRALMARNKAR